MAKEALLVIDMLNDFVEENSPLKTPAAKTIIPDIQKRIQDARQKGMIIIYVCDAHSPNDKEFTKWPPHALKGTRGAEIIEELKPHLEDSIVLKDRYSGFQRTFGTNLDLLLESWGVKRIYITGILTNICIFFTAVEASMRDYEVVIWADSVAALSEKDHEIALDQMERVLKIEVIR